MWRRPSSNRSWSQRLRLSFKRVAKVILGLAGVNVVTEHRLHAVTCECCGAVTRADLPAGVPGGAFRPRLMALILLLRGAYRVSLRHVEEFFTDTFGVEISLGSLKNVEDKVSNVLARASRSSTRPCGSRRSGPCRRDHAPGEGAEVLPVGGGHGGGLHPPHPDLMRGRGGEGTAGPDRPDCGDRPLCRVRVDPGVVPTGLSGSPPEGLPEDGGPRRRGRADRSCSRIRPRRDLLPLAPVQARGGAATFGGRFSRSLPHRTRESLLDGTAGAAIAATCRKILVVEPAM